MLQRDRQEMGKRAMLAIAGIAVDAHDRFVDRLRIDVMRYDHRGAADWPGAANRFRLIKLMIRFQAR